MRDIIDRYNSARLEPAPKELLAEAMNEITRLRVENETLRRDVKTAIMGDSAELQDMKRENEKLRDALISAAGELEYAYIMSFKDQYRDAARAARKAVESLQENKDEN